MRKVLHPSLIADQLSGQAQAPARTIGFFPHYNMLNKCSVHNSLLSRNVILIALGYLPIAYNDNILPAILA